jgi:hypothetical protein
VIRAKKALWNQLYFASANADPHPLVFRTSAACRAYRWIHRFDADELDAWRAGTPWPKDLPQPAIEDDVEE